MSGSKLIERVIDSAMSQDVELLINAGDTHHDWTVRDYVRTRVVAAGLQYFDVCGNHDLYGNEWNDPFNQIKNYTFGDLKVLASPMWTDFNHDPIIVEFARKQISDFYHIDYVTPGKMQAMFRETLETIDLTKPDLVVTHFGASSRSIHPRWAGQMLNGYFCPNALGQVKHQPKFFLHGHIHDPMEYDAGDTRVIANPYGYPMETYQDVNDYNVKVVDIV